MRCLSINQIRFLPVPYLIKQKSEFVEYNKRFDIVVCYNIKHSAVQEISLHEYFLNVIKTHVNNNQSTELLKLFH